jgi:hypothetical protein
MICEGCGQEIVGNHERNQPCRLDTLVIQGRTFDRVPFQGEDDGDSCHDCGTPLGGVHHSYCDMEECPACGGQLISCGHRPDFLPHPAAFGR